MRWKKVWNGVASSTWQYSGQIDGTSMWANVRYVHPHGWFWEAGGWGGSRMGSPCATALGAKRAAGKVMRAERALAVRWSGQRW